MDAHDVVRLRLRAQQLREPSAATAEDALQNLLAVQAQEFPYARWTLAQRTAGGYAAGIERAVSEGTILRTHILRPTWHFVYRQDLRWLLALSAPRVQQANAGTYRRTGIDAASAARSSDVLAGAVAGGAHKTREQLAAELRRAGFGAEGLELAYRIMYAELSGVLVSGSPVRSAAALRHTYALFDERVPAAPDGLTERPRALAELVRRYFTSRGPATEKDCADWSRLTLSDVRTGLRVLRETAPDALDTATVDGAAGYFSPGADAGAAGGKGRLDLIQCYDEYVMGYSTTRHFLGGPAPLLPGAGEPLHLVLRNGRLAGVWRHTLVRGRCELDVRLDSSRHPGDGPELGRVVAAYGSFLGMPAVRL